jgi:hypothetical protein
MSEEPPKPFPPSAFVKAGLLREPVYAEDEESWRTLLHEHEEIAEYFRQIGLELMLDEGEGFAFLRQIEPVGEERVPRLVRRQKLSYDATLLLVCLRDELNRFDAQTADQTRLIRSRRELHELAGGYLRDSNNEPRDVKALDTAIESLRALGFLKMLSGEAERFEVRRIIKARFGAGELETVKEKLTRHAGGV